MLRHFLAKVGHGMQAVFAKLAARKGVVAVLAFAVIGIAAFAPGAHAQDSFGGTIALMLAYVLSMFVQFVGQLLLIMVSVLLWVAQYNGFVNSVPVAQGWSIVRDVANMFFIVIMLMLAFGTIFGSDQYSYKGRLFGVLIMAVVVNFSRTICGLLIDMSQVVMLTFIYGFKEAAGGNFVDALRLTKIMQVRQDLGADSEISGTSIAVAMLLALFMVIISLVVVTLMTITLAVRIVWLWLLIVLSPLAFMLRNVPGGQAKKYYGQWWGMFNGQLIVGPVLAFFLWLSLISVSSPDFMKKEYVQATGGAGQEVITGEMTEAFKDSEIQAFIMSICMLLGGLKIATGIANNVGTASGAGASALGKAKTALSWGRTGYRGTAAVAGAGAAAGAWTAGKVSGRGTEGILKSIATGGAPLGIGTGWAQNRLIDKEAKKKKYAEEAAKEAKQHGEEVTAYKAGKQKGRIGKMFESDADKAQQAAFQQKRLLDLAKKSKKTALSPEEQDEARGYSEALSAYAEKKGGSAKKDMDDFFAKELYKKSPKMALFSKGTETERAEAYAKAAGSMNISEVPDMNATDVDDRFMANQTAKRVIEMQKVATGDTLEKLLKYGTKEKEIEANLRELRKKPEVFGYISPMKQNDTLGKMSEGEVAKMVGDSKFDSAFLSANLLKKMGEQGKLGAIADKAVAGISAADLQANPQWATDIAAMVSDEALKNANAEVAGVLLPLVAEKSKQRALNAGASMGQVFAGYKGGGNFDSPTSMESFDTYMTGGGSIHRNVGALPVADLSANGGLNNVSGVVLSNMDDKDFSKLVSSGYSDQANAVLTAASAYQDLQGRMLEIQGNMNKAAESGDEAGRAKEAAKLDALRRQTMMNDTVLDLTLKNAEKILAVNQQIEDAANPERAARREVSEKKKQDRKTRGDRKAQQRADRKLLEDDWVKPDKS